MNKLTYNFEQTTCVFNPITKIGALQVDSYLHNSLALNFAYVKDCHTIAIQAGYINKPYQHTAAYNICPIYRLTHGNGISL